MTVTQQDLQALVDRLAEEHQVPGATVGVFDGEQVVTAAAGIANANTGVAMTPDTLFLTGSITKVWVTTALMVLVDRGELSLDDTVQSYLPTFRLADQQAAEALTIRHLVTHTSGIDAADYAPDDLGRGEDGTARYVERMAEMGQLYAPGELWSYCNPGFIIAARVIEMVTDRTFDAALRELVIDPLALPDTVLTAEEAILRRVSIGHFPDGQSGSIPTSRYLLPHSMAGAGATLTTTVADSLAFAQLHLAKGTAVDGTQIVSSESVAAMASHQIDMPVPGLGSSGLGWARNDRSGTLILSHGGGSIGGLAQLSIVPERGVAYVAFANSSGSANFHAALMREALGGLLGVPVADPYVDAGEPAPAEYFAGTYRRKDFDVRIEADGDDVVMTTTPTSEVLKAYANTQSVTVRCRPSGPNSFALPAEASGAAITAAAFTVGEADGRPQFLYSGGRLVRRVG